MTIEELEATLEKNGFTKTTANEMWTFWHRADGRQRIRIRADGTVSREVPDRAGKYSWAARTLSEAHVSKCRLVGDCLKIGK